jgi:cbb3-type cytochrome oxidase subunit 3
MKEHEASHGTSRGFTSLWATFLAFGFFMASLFILLTKTDLKWQVPGMV